MTTNRYATMMDKNYNSSREKLHLPEYGRHIQNMVDTLLEIEDRAERNKQAHAVIAVMGNLNPLLRDTADYTHKLWDHLFIISDFQLDVDSPYPRPTREEIEVKPQKLPYTQSRFRFKHYGKYVGQMIRSLSVEQNAEAVALAVDNIARYMRTKSFEYNQEHPNNEVIIKDIRLMAESDINIDETAINNIRSDYKNNQGAHYQKNGRNQRNNKNPMQRRDNNNNNNNNNNKRNQHQPQHQSQSQHQPQHQNRNFSKNNSQRRNVNR